MSAIDQRLIDAITDAAGCRCCSNMEPLADLLGIDHCEDANSVWCDLDEDYSGDVQCPWHRGEFDFHTALTVALAAAELAENTPNPALCADLSASGPPSAPTPIQTPDRPGETK